MVDGRFTIRWTLISLSVGPRNYYPLNHGLLALEPCFCKKILKKSRLGTEIFRPALTVIIVISKHLVQPFWEAPLFVEAKIFPFSTRHCAKAKAFGRGGAAS